MQRMNVGQIKNHPDYNDVTTNNDFALLRLKKAVDFCTHSHIRPICLPTDTSESFAGVDAIVTGWGTTSSGGSLSSSMLEVTLKVLTNNQCKNDYSYASSMITSKMLCANVDGGGKDSCQVMILDLSVVLMTVIGRLWWTTGHCRVKQQLSADRSCFMGVRLCSGKCPGGLCQVRTNH